MTDFHFLRPVWLFGLAVAPWLLWVTARHDDLRRKWAGIIAKPLLDHLVVSGGARARIRPVHLTVLMIVVASISAAGPSWRREQPPFVEDRAPLVIAIDLSKDMDAIDVTPTRLERAKLKVRDLLARRRGARTAVIAYAGSAHVVLPLTDDASLLQTYTDALETNVMPLAGRNTAAVITVTQRVLEHEPTPGTLLFLASGIEDAAFEPLKALADAGRLQPLVVGIGTEAGGLDVAALRRLHDQDGIPVATVTTDATDVDWIERRVQSHLQARRTEENVRWKDEGWWLTLPLALGGALWFRKGWTVRWSAAAIAMMLLTPSPASAQGRWWDDLWWTADQQGQRALDRGDYLVAADRFGDPFHKGVAFYRAGKFTEAVFWFGRVDTPESDFNQGNALAHLGKLPEAVAHYEAALQRRPDFPAARANLELVRKLIPPNKKPDDGQAVDPSEKPDEVKYDDKGKKGKAGRVDFGVAQTADVWMRNIQTTPSGLLRRRFAIEAQK